MQNHNVNINTMVHVLSITKIMFYQGGAIHPYLGILQIIGDLTPFLDDKAYGCQPIECLFKLFIF